MRTWVLAASWLVLGACGGDETTSELCGPSVAAQSWETFGQGFLTSQCQGCHASAAVDRFGAPEDVAFDTEADALDWADRILARATGPDADMPPAGGPSEQDRERLRRWLLCDL
ncbi:MAG: hypothetical protein KTR31_25150 [Myxococcales bacterium]|nr:hypothetical protein [Myxococcales bacterium]